MWISKLEYEQLQKKNKELEAEVYRLRDYKLWAEAVPLEVGDCVRFYETLSCVAIGEIKKVFATEKGNSYGKYYYAISSKGSIYYRGSYEVSKLEEL